jgi:hypothetical protein
MRRRDDERIGHAKARSFRYRFLDPAAPNLFGDIHGWSLSQIYGYNSEKRRIFPSDE